MSSHEAETVRLPKGGKRPVTTSAARASAEGSVAPTAGTTGVGSPLEALERDEILRTRWFCGLVTVLALAACAAVVLIPGGDPLAQKVVFGGVAGGIGGMLFILYQSLSPVRFRQPRTALGWFLPAICVNTAVLFFGVFSPAPMVAVLGIYFLGLGQSGRMAVEAYIICALAHAALAVQVISGGRDIGIVQPELTTTQQVIVQVLVQLVMATTIITARLSRRTALVAVGELEAAVRLAAHRQALLLEARDELQRAQRAKRGRFSEQKIGDYELGELLGRGAMGEVYAGVDARNGSLVAVKLLSQASIGNPDLVRRFMRELRTAARVDSPHVVSVIEVGETPVPYLVMERLEGATLSDILRDRRTLSAHEVIELVEHVGAGITAASRAGIIHRDLKPQNVFRHRDTWKVLDFGVARALEHGDTLTAGHVVGTPSYMAPEQARGETVDHRTDLYALAAIAYRALTGHPPFTGKEVADTLYRVVHMRPVRPTLLAPELHPDVDHALSIGLAPTPAARFATSDELAAALRDALVGNLASALRERAERGPGWSNAAHRKSVRLARG